MVEFELESAGFRVSRRQCVKILHGSRAVRFALLVDPHCEKAHIRITGKPAHRITAVPMIKHPFQNIGQGNLRIAGREIGDDPFDQRTHVAAVFLVSLRRANIVIVTGLLVAGKDLQFNRRSRHAGTDQFDIPSICWLMPGCWG